MGCSESSARVHSDEKEGRDFFEKYILGVQVGQGAFAQVRKCTRISTGPLQPEEDEKAKLDRAVKILDLRGTKDGEEMECVKLKRSARNESSVWKTVSGHPNCVRLYSTYFHEGICFMVMEMCASTLLKSLENLPDLNERSLGNILSQMLTAIAHCHSAKVLHRDVKPDNFLAGGADRQTIKLADFGLSCVIPKSGKVPGIFGTAPFMCPEMLVGRSYDDKADVWSYGVIAYVFLFGLFPYMPKTQSSKEMKAAIIEGGVTGGPSFEATSKYGTDGRMRSEIAVSFVKRLIHRDPQKRPSAQEALQMPWMTEVVKDRHMQGVDLPSLRPMLHAAKKIGAFEVRDPCRHNRIDDLLKPLQLLNHGEPLPGHRKEKRDERNTDAVVTNAITRLSSKSSTSGHSLESLKDWDSHSFRSSRSTSASTTCDSPDRCGRDHRYPVGVTTYESNDRSQDRSQERSDGGASPLSDLLVA